MTHWRSRHLFPHGSSDLPTRFQTAHLGSLPSSGLLRIAHGNEPPPFGPGDKDARRYNPNQPRVPAGHPDGGQWTSGTDSLSTAENPSLTVAAARRRGMSEAFCAAQLAIDILLCNSLRPTWRREACRSQAMERYAACLRGRPLPPLPF